MLTSNILSVFISNIYDYIELKIPMTKFLFLPFIYFVKVFCIAQNMISYPWGNEFSHMLECLKTGFHTLKCNYFSKAEKFIF